MVYKPSEGYWVRVLTAAGLGVFFLAAAAWLYTQLGAYDPPIKHWEVTVGGVATPPAPGATIEFLSTKTQTGAATAIGRGTVQSFAPGAAGQGTLAVGNVEMVAGEVVENTVNQPAKIAGADGPTISIASVRGVHLFDRMYLQAGVAVLILVLGTGITYYMVGVRRNSVEFLIATDAEMKKVNWSTRKEIMGSTYVVIGACFLIAGLLFVFDKGLSELFTLIRILRPHG